MSWDEVMFTQDESQSQNRLTQFQTLMKHEQISLDTTHVYNIFQFPRPEKFANVFWWFQLIHIGISMDFHIHGCQWMVNHPGFAHSESCLPLSEAAWPRVAGFTQHKPGVQPWLFFLRCTDTEMNHEKYSLSHPMKTVLVDTLFGSIWLIGMLIGFPTMSDSPQQTLSTASPYNDQSKRVLLMTHIDMGSRDHIWFTKLGIVLVK